MEYKASLDTVAKIITAGTIVLFLFLGYRSVKVLMLSQGNATAMLIHGGVLLLFIALLLGCYLFAPHYYRVENNNLIIVRPANNKIIKLSDIEVIRPVENSEMLGAIRTFGNGGLFGYFGKYYYPKIGNVNLYATQRKNRIFIETKQGLKFIITPDDLSIIDNIKGKIGVR